MLQTLLSKLKSNKDLPETLDNWALHAEPPKPNPDQQVLLQQLIVLHQQLISLARLHQQLSVDLLNSLTVLRQVMDDLHKNVTELTQTAQVSEADRKKIDESW